MNLISLILIHTNLLSVQVPVSGWVKALIATHPTRSNVVRLAATPKNPKTDTSYQTTRTLISINADPFQWSEEDIARMERDSKLASLVSKQVRTLFESGDLWGARATLIQSEITGRRPDMLSDLCDLDVRLGLNEEVIQLATPWVAKGYDDPHLLLPLSLASARLGRVYEGQRDYVRSNVRTRANSPADSFLPKDGSVRTVALLSLIANGDQFSITGDDLAALWYYEQAAKYGPNPKLEYLMARTYAGQKRFKEAFACLDAMEKHSPTSQEQKASNYAVRQQIVLNQRDWEKSQKKQ